MYDEAGAPTFVSPGGSATVASAIGNPYAFTGRRWDAALPSPGLWQTRSVGRIAGGHAGKKHFDGYSVDEVAEYIKDVMNSPDDYRHLKDDRIAFWDIENEVIIIVDKLNEDLGTAFLAERGYCQFLELK